MTDPSCEDGKLDLPANVDTLRDDNVDRALRRLEERGELTPQQRVAVERLADRLTGALLNMFDVDDENPESADADYEMRGVALCQD